MVKVEVLFCYEFQKDCVTYTMYIPTPTEQDPDESPLEFSARAGVNNRVHSTVAVTQPEDDFKQPGRHMTAAA